MSGDRAWAIRRLGGPATVAATLYVIALGGATGCLGSDTTKCGDQVCPEGFDCAPVHGLCVRPLQLINCVGLPDGEVCDIPSQDPGVCDQEVCIPSFCGDGRHDPNEECDAGEANSDTIPGACREDCRLPWCGDGVMDSGELCDEGAANSDTAPDVCRTTCQLPSCADGVVDAGEDCDDGNTTPWDGCTQCEMSEFLVSPLGEYPSVGVAADGSFVVIWENNGIQGQAYSAAGAPEGAVFDVSVDSVSDYRRPRMAMAPDGRWVAAWYRTTSVGGEFSVHARQFSGASTAQGGEIDVAAPTSFMSFGFVGVGIVDDGSFGVTWHTLEGAPDYMESYVRWYDASGTALGAAASINSYGAGAQEYPEISRAGDGTTVVVWESDGQDPDGIGVYGQRYAASGSAVGPEFQLENTPPGADLGDPVVAVLSDGRFVALWRAPDASSSGTFGRLFTATGTPVGSVFAVNDHTELNQNTAAVAATPSGGFIAVWNSQGQDGSLTGIVGKIFDANGVDLSGELMINRLATGDQREAAIAVAADGTFVVVWHGDVEGVTARGVFAQRFTSSGVPLGGG